MRRLSPAFHGMILRAHRSVRLAVYLVAWVVFFALARLLGSAIWLPAPGEVPSVPAFFVVIAVAMGVFGLGAWIEEKYLWSGWFSPQEDELERIGSRSRLLRSAAPPPMALGAALGLLSIVMR